MGRRYAPGPRSAVAVGRIEPRLRRLASQYLDQRAGTQSNPRAGRADRRRGRGAPDRRRGRGGIRHTDLAGYDSADVRAGGPRLIRYHSRMRTSPAVDWTAIDTVLLDMDGTILDLRFDNWFWQELIPRRYAAANGLTEAAAQRLLKPKFLAIRGTMQWYCVDHWTRELGLDIAGIKREALAEVDFLPGAEEFLRKLRLSGKRCVLV